MALNVSVDMRVESWIFIGDSLAVKKMENDLQSQFTKPKVGHDFDLINGMSNCTFHMWNKLQNVTSLHVTASLLKSYFHISLNPYLLFFLLGPLKALFHHLLQCDSHQDLVRLGNWRTLLY